MFISPFASKSLISRTGVSRLSRLSGRSFASLEPYDDYGKALFKGTVADGYLKNHGLDASILDDPSWTSTHADGVAKAVLDWASDHEANVYCHWFQPMGASGVRHGLSAQVHNRMMAFDQKTGDLVWDFKGKHLVKGETDGSSYPNGGLRGTHCAGGYLAIDTSSPIFLRGDTVFIPSAFVSYYGAALDEKTPLLRANAALSKQGKRLLKHLGLDVTGIKTNIGLEQEVFFVPRDEYYRRPDLQMAGRTIIGKLPPRGQEMCDHYMAPFNTATPVLACMTEIQNECFKLGIPLKTRHREVAPNQFEFAPLFGTNTTQIDQNLMVMQIIEEVAPRYGLAALLQEKPFDGINGSGKHNNWSLSTDCDLHLLEPKVINEATKSDDAFPVIMAAVVAAIDEYGDLMRMSIASPGNDFRLGACEAPPAIVSTYLGGDMTGYLEAFKDGTGKGAYNPGVKTIDLNVDSILPFQVPAEDRNRTSPFPYGGARFEYRAVGSSQNVSMVNTVLNTIVADKFANFSDRIEAGESAADIAKEELNKHWKVIFNGDNYDENCQKELTERGVWRIDSGVEAIHTLSSPKNIALFEKMGVMSKEECLARADVLHDHYAGTVEMEALTLIDMINQHVIPSVTVAGVGPVDELTKSVGVLKEALAAMHAATTSYETAQLARVLRLETMIDVRVHCDAAEELVPEDKWTLATYKQLLFLDSHTAPPREFIEY